MAVLKQLKILIFHDWFFKMNNELGIGVFAYNRPSHLKRVFLSITNNKIKKFHLFIDGPKNNIDVENIKTINFIVREMNQKKNHIVIHNQDKNIGLRKSIFFGADLLSKKYKKFIIIEDDCILYSNFINFIKSNLKKTVFKKNNIGAVYGFQFNEIQQQFDDLYPLLVSNFIPWGWGTLSEYWLEFRKSKKILKNSKSYFNTTKKDLNFWSKDFINYNFDKGLKFICPSINLIKNIGFDGSGVNSIATSDFNTKEKIPINIDLKNCRYEIKIDKKHIQQLSKKAKMFY